MSWSLIKVAGVNEAELSLLDKKIQEAAGAGIIMYCAAADQSLYGGNKEIYPAKADTYHIKSVGSAQEHGEGSKFVDQSQVDYLFPGENIKELGNPKGSSAATAIASGTAALILWCFEKHLGKGGSKQIADPKKMHYLFSKLKHKDSKWVDATTLFNDNSKLATVVDYCKRRIDTMD